ncbi:hypothetical protein [Adhaeribacter pallidiroseus]|uniref:Uncharacterized protein n=1 Tax=Adhaeribacter pallidiroseus TaxID=2072847 RepID=A0A369QHE8_9BACT|nr:hypothetical protein [Adhaeribacter pallidiroseus]RDC62309.1 hypothetical protein AHMF7616_00902 [Adhaeribacter pallidiroseus]
MKVAFYLLQGPVENYLYDIENKGLHFSILKKVNNIVFYLPYTPAKGMLVQLARFNAIFKFSKAELELLDSTGAYVVSDLSMTPEHLELWLTFKEDY